MDARRTASTRLVGALVVSAVMAGCPTVVTTREEAVPEIPAAQLGPTLVVDVMNASKAEHAVSYEFTFQDSGGGGEGAILACERMTLAFGEIRGDYSIHVDSVAVLEGRVPPNAPAGGHLVVRVSIAPDGTATAAAPIFLARGPDPEPRPLAACG